ASARARARPSDTGSRGSPCDRSCLGREARANDLAVRGSRPGAPDDGRERRLRAELARADRPEETHLLRAAPAAAARLPRPHPCTTSAWGRLQERWGRLGFARGTAGAAGRWIVRAPIWAARWQRSMSSP